MPATLTEEVIRTCASLIRAAPHPLSLNEIREQLPKELRFSGNLKNNAAAALRELPAADGIAVWPNFGRQRDLFWNRAFPEAVREAIPLVLDDAPMTAAQVAEGLKRRVPKAGATKLRDESRAQLRSLSAGLEVIRIGNHYCAANYLRRIAGGGTNLSELILEALQQAESGPGNYVTLPELRKAPAMRKAVHEAIIRLARDGRVFLAGFDTTPRPEEEPNLLEIGNEWYVGVGRKRGFAGTE